TNTVVLPPAPGITYRLSRTFLMVPVGGIRGRCCCGAAPATARLTTMIAGRSLLRAIGRGTNEREPAGIIRSRTSRRASSEAPPQTDEWIGGSSLLDVRPPRRPHLRQLLRRRVRKLASSVTTQALGDV